MAVLGFGDFASTRNWAADRQQMTNPGVGKPYPPHDAGQSV